MDKYQFIENNFYFLDMKEPVYEFDFPVPYRRPPVWFPKKQAFNLYECILILEKANNNDGFFYSNFKGI